jgi:RNA polymerase sigma-70 factor (ECF subfamily)
LLQLTEDQQHVIALRFGQGLNLAETAEILGRSVGAVKALQHRALAALARIVPAEVANDR